MSIGELLQERMLFLSTFLRSPGQVGSVTPSSKHLAQAMTKVVPWEQVRNVAELGAGTGAVTKYIQEAASKDTRVLLFEKDDVMRKDLCLQYKDYPCYTDATGLKFAMLYEQMDQLDCIFSCLPFFNFSPKLREQIIRQVLLSLKEDGLFIAFQYSKQMQKQFSQYFDIQSINFVPLNIPPAFVYVCTKKKVVYDELD
ncbi:phospholipid methyltransferase [Paenibacillus albiflavus]|uniref:Phospholipid methyltransferase n=1 Tax=Paenibacillus albiflavus TaxID=2545760 RepID=A0A4R4ELX6_9BACL|nr:phospholipid methyltransferase [Paenibacillus albiflavus]TCZ81286.1 phospholipid methyltransferase [Paenibacillus albiflavus]